MIDGRAVGRPRGCRRPQDSSSEQYSGALPMGGQHWFFIHMNPIASGSAKRTCCKEFGGIAEGANGGVRLGSESSQLKSH